MTVSSTSTRTVSYAGDGGSGPFPIPFRVLEANDLKAALVADDGTRMVLDAFTVTGAGEPSGAAVTTAEPVGVGETLVLWTETALVQPADYLAGDAFPAETHEAALDRLTLIAQDARRDIARAVLVPIGGTPPTYDEMIVAAAGTITDAGIALINAAGENQVEAVNNAGEGQIALTGDAGDIQVGLVDAKGAAEIALVEAAGDAKIAALATMPSVNVKAYASTAAGITAGDVFFAVPMDYSKAALVYENVSSVATYRETVPWLGGYFYPAAIVQQRASGRPEALLGRNGLFCYNMVDGWDSDKQRVPNSLFPENVSDNRLLLNSGYLGSVTNATVIVKAGTGPGGDTTAALLTYNNGSTVSFFGPIVLPAGDYVFTYKAKNNQAGTITLRHGKSNASTSYTTDNISDAGWTTIADSFTADGSSAYSYGVGNNSGSAQQVLVDELQLYHADDGAPVTWSAEEPDLSLRRNIRTPNSLNISPELLDVTATGQVFHAKLPDFPDHTTLEGLTIYASMRSTGDLANRAFILTPGDASQATHTSNGFNRFHFGPRYTTAQNRSYLELVYPGGQYEAYMDMEAYSDKLQTVIATFDDTGANIFVDGYEVGPSELAQPLTPAPLTEAFFKFFGSQNASAVPPAAETITPSKVAIVAAEKGRIPVGKARQMTDRLRASTASLGLGIVDGPNVTFTEGDSILHGNPREDATTVAHLLRHETTPVEWVVPMGAAGSTLFTSGGNAHLSLWGRQPRLLRNLERAYSQDRNVILIGQIGANDFASIISSPSGYYADLQGYWQSLRDEFPDLIILWGDVLPRQNAGGFVLESTFNPARNTFNGLIAGAPAAGYVSAIIPFGTDATMGLDAVPNDSTYYASADKLHPTRNGSPNGNAILLANTVAVWEDYLV